MSQEDLQFPCPVCGTMLRLPRALAGVRGPCPKCASEISAPDPDREVGSLEIKEERELPPPAPTPAAPAARGVAGPCLATGLAAMALGLAAGWWLGRESIQSAEAPPTVTAAPPAPQMPIERPAEPAPAPEPTPEPSAPPATAAAGEPAPEPPAAEPPTVASQAEAALRAFLEAPDWASRNAHVLFPEKMLPAMEAYSRQASDGPTPYESIAVTQSRVDEQSGRSLMIFHVQTPGREHPIPVPVQETERGWLVDWPAFVEFRDSLFQKFAEGPAGQSGTFRLLVTQPPPERAARADNAYFAPVLLQSPVSNQQHLAFVKKDSPAYEEISARLGDGVIFAPALEIAKHEASGGKTYLEVVRVTAPDWLPREPEG